MDCEPVPLLDCPAEIRQTIRTYSLGDRQLTIGGFLPSVDSVTSRPEQSEIEFLSVEEGEDAPLGFLATNLLLTSRLIRAEAEPVLYKTNLFTFHSDSNLQKWLSRRTDGQKSWLKAIGLSFGYCPWNFGSVVLPQNIVSVHLFGFTHGWEQLSGPEEAEIHIVKDLDQTIGVILRNDLKVKHISLVMFLGVFGKTKEESAKDNEKRNLVKRSLVYCRDMTLKYLNSNPTNHIGSNPYQWLAERASSQWLLRPGGEGLEDYLLLTLNA